MSPAEKYVERLKKQLVGSTITDVLIDELGVIGLETLRGHDTTIAWVLSDDEGNEPGSLGIVERKKYSKDYIEYALDRINRDLPLQVDALRRAWDSVFYFYPRLHPDGYDAPDSGWPKKLKPLAQRAWERFKPAYLYPLEAQRAGLEALASKRNK